MSTTRSRPPFNFTSFSSAPAFSVVTVVDAEVLPPLPFLFPTELLTFSADFRFGRLCFTFFGSS